MSLSGRAAIAGIGATEFSTDSGRSELQLSCEATLAALADLGPALVSDEIYDGLVYGEAATCPALSLGDAAFAVDGFSKRYAMTGFRLGWVVAPEAALRGLQSLAQNLFITASAFAQRGGIAALAGGAAHAASMRAALEQRRKRLLDGLLGLGFGVPVPPAGAFYVFADALLTRDDLRLRILVQEWLWANSNITKVPRPDTCDEPSLIAAAALVGLLALRKGQAPPAWTADVGALPEPFFVMERADRPGFTRELCLNEAPEPLKKRNIFAPPNFLVMV